MNARGRFALAQVHDGISGHFGIGHHQKLTVRRHHAGRTQIDALHTHQLSVNVQHIAHRDSSFEHQYKTADDIVEEPLKSNAHAHHQRSGSCPNRREVQAQDRQDGQDGCGPHYGGHHTVYDEALAFIQLGEPLSTAKRAPQQAEYKPGKEDDHHHFQHVENGNGVVT